MSCILCSGVKILLCTIVGDKSAYLGDRGPLPHRRWLVSVVCLFGQQLLFSRESGGELRKQSKVQRKEERK